jgi:hypothetical protein
MPRDPNRLSGQVLGLPHPSIVYDASHLLLAFACSTATVALTPQRWSALSWAPSRASARRGCVHKHDHPLGRWWPCERDRGSSFAALSPGGRLFVSNEAHPRLLFGASVSIVVMALSLMAGHRSPPRRTQSVARAENAVRLARRRAGLWRRVLADVASHGWGQTLCRRARSSARSPVL